MTTLSADSSGWRAASIESAAKVRACWLVLRGSPGPPRPVERRRLLDLVARAYRQPPFAIPFVLEAIGYRWSLASDEARPFASLPGAELPAASSPLLHAGLGLATARSLFRQPASSAGEVARRVDRFREEIARRAEPDYAPIAIEALGLVLRLLRRPQLLPALERLAATDPAAAAMAAHGAGRALYFRPWNLLPRPDAICQALAQVRREFAIPGLRAEAEKGVVFAFVFVTLHRPAVAATLLARRGDEVERLAAWMPGLTAAVMVRALTVPDDPGPQRFLDLPLAGAVAGRWRRLVTDPGRAWLETLRASTQ